MHFAEVGIGMFGIVVRMIAVARLLEMSEVNCRAFENRHVEPYTEPCCSAVRTIECHSLMRAGSGVAVIAPTGIKIG